jgi:hypothetical protein
VLSVVRLLQLLFDVSISQMILGSDSTTSKMYSQTLESLEAKLDPVDWELYGPLLHSRVQRYASRCSLLLASLAAPHADAAEAKPSPEASAAAEQRHVVPVAEPSPRFALLPAPRRDVFKKAGRRAVSKKAEEASGPASSQKAFFAKAGSLVGAVSSNIFSSGSLFGGR